MAEPPAPLRIRDVIRVVESIAPLDSGNPGDEQGLLTGDAEEAVRGVACMWCVQRSSLERAAELGCNLLVVHESPFAPAHTSSWYDGPRTANEVRVNAQRRGLIERYGFAIYRIHSAWDALSGDGVPDQAVAALGLPGLRVAAIQKYFKVHALDQPMTVADLAGRARAGLRMPWPPRIFGDPQRSISRFAFLIGGFGGNQHHMPQAARDLGAEAILVGEMLESIAVSANELGMPVIETLHSLSEMPAIRRQANLLAARLPGTPVHFIDSGATAR